MLLTLAMLAKITEVAELRQASAVERCHRFKHIGEYSTGFHSFNMLLLCHQFYPDASKELLWAIIAHDLSEIKTGDIPHDFIQRNETLKKELELVDTKFLKKHRLVASSQLGDHERRHLAVLDKLELLLWVLDQKELGNNTPQLLDIYDNLVLMFNYWRLEPGKIPKAYHEYLWAIEIFKKDDEDE